MSLKINDSIFESEDTKVKEIENNINNSKKADLTGKRIVMFLVLTFIITYIFEFTAMYINSTGKNISQILLTGTGAIAMFLPAVCVILTRIITKEGSADSYLKLIEFKKNLKYYLIAWFVPSLLIILGAVLYFIIFRADYSPEMEYLSNVYKGQGVTVTPDQLTALLVSQTVTAIFLAPLLNCITCFGEEWGWRGYLLPKMLEKMSVLPAVIISGIIWGLWHLPLIIMGHNYGVNYNFYPYGGILAMCVFCIFVGAFLSFVTIKSKSCIPAIIGHGAINGMASVGIYYSKTGGNPFIGPSAVGIIGGLPLLITAVVMIIILVRDEKSKKDVTE